MVIRTPAEAAAWYTLRDWLDAAPAPTDGRAALAAELREIADHLRTDQELYQDRLYAIAARLDAAPGTGEGHE